MGCGASDTQIKQQKNVLSTAKAVILLFYLPGNSKEDFSNMIATQVGPIPGNKNINFRFLDAANNRGYRRYWIKEVSTKTDRAAAFYVGDIREKPNFFLNVKTLNWFVKSAGPPDTLTIVLLCNDEKNLEEFNEMVSFRGVNILPLYENNAESIHKVINLLTDYSNRFLDCKKSRPSSPKSPKSFRY